MTEWWSQLTLELQAFYGVGIVASVVLLIQLAMTVLGFDSDAADMADAGDMGFDSIVDADIDVDGGGLHVLSTRTVIAFMAGFGWTGVVCLKNDLALLWALLIALAVGTSMMLLVYLMMRTLFGLRQSGSLNYKNAIGQTGSVYIRIPSVGNGEGQVEVMVQERLRTVAACTEHSTELVSGTKIRVTGLIAARTLVVEPLFESSVE